MMPRMDGFEVCRRLKANPRTADIPVVMVTALSDVADRVRGLEAGADDFLTKPVNDIALFARVRSLVRLKRMMEEWRLREEICGRFGNGGAGAELDRGDPARRSCCRAAELCRRPHRRDAGAARAAACVGRQRRRGAARARRLDRSGHPQPVDAGWRPAAPGRRSGAPSESFRQLPILLLADEGELPRLAKGLDLGANDYLIRPVDRNELLARVRTQVRRKRLQDRLRENYRRSLSLALTDELTGLYNRRYVVAHLEGLVARVNNDGAGDTALMMFDVDRSSRSTTATAMPRGDDVLRQLAARALRGVRSFDLVARFGGEEFVVVMPETTSRRRRWWPSACARGRGRAVHHRRRRRAPPITISIGGRGGDSRRYVDTLLQRADDALYEAKAAGRNRVVVHAAGLGGRFDTVPPPTPIRIEV